MPQIQTERNRVPNDTRSGSASLPANSQETLKSAELDAMPGQVLGYGFPDWPEDLKTFEERRAYQRGVAHARAVDAAIEDRPSRAASPLGEVYARHMATARSLGFANVRSALSGLQRRLTARMLTRQEILGTWNGHEGTPAWAERVADVIRKFCEVNGLELEPSAATPAHEEGKPTPKYVPGDKVTFTNDYGVVFPGKMILAIDDTEWADGEVRYFIEPTDTPWFAVRESQLATAQKPLQRPDHGDAAEDGSRRSREAPRG